MKRNDWWMFGFVVVWSVLMLLLQGCFGEPPDVGALAAEDDESSSSSSGTALVTSAGTAGGSGEATSNGSDDDDGFAPDGSADSGSESGSSSTGDASSSEGSSSSGYGPTPYPACEECSGQPCIDDGAGSGACAPPCAAGCPDPGWGEPTCLADVADGVAAPVCFLDCTSSEECEDGMLCEPIAYTSGGATLHACVWEGGGPQ